MTIPAFKRLPKHIGVIPDGNRRWAKQHGLSKEAGYDKGVTRGFELYELCVALGIEEMTLYGFTQDNTKRPASQTRAFQKACVEAVRGLVERNAELLVVGQTDSPLFPPELAPYAGKRVVLGAGGIRINFLANYGWLWDLNAAFEAGSDGRKKTFIENMASADVSRVDLVIRWGGRRRLSGFLPVQCVYADFYIVDTWWPDFAPEQLYEALLWYDEQDVTLGG